MINQTYGPRRCRDTRKPRLSECPDLHFYRCNKCGALYQKVGIDLESLDTKSANKIICCNEEVEELIPKNREDVKEIEISYKIVGGYNDNAVQVFWKSDNKNIIPEWICLKTFTGGYLKYLSEGKKAPMIFALADLDAFAYCDEDPCLECVFRCKRGFEIYVYTENIGLIKVPLDKMTAQWQSEK